MRLYTSRLSNDFSVDWTGFLAFCPRLKSITFDSVHKRVVLCRPGKQVRRVFFLTVIRGLRRMSSHNNRECLQQKLINHQPLCYTAGDCASEVTNKLYLSVVWHCEVSIFLCCQEFKQSSTEVLGSDGKFHDNKYQIEYSVCKN